MNNYSQVDIIFNRSQSDSIDSSDVNDEVYFLILFVANVIIANILSLIGILGSLLNILILSHHTMQDTTNVVLLAISVCDLIYSFTQISFNFSRYAATLDINVFQWAIILHILCFDRINYLALLLSIHLVTLVSIERMVAVCFPFQVSRVLTLSRMKFVIFIIIVGNILFQCPSYFQYEMYYIDYTNLTLPVLKYTDLISQNFSTLDEYSTMIMLLLFSVCPFCIICICTCMTILHLSFRSKAKVTLASIEAFAKRKKEMKSVKIVLIICVLILLLVLIPLSVHQMLLYIVVIDISRQVISITFWFVNILVQINSSFNFIIYVTGSPKFKRTFLKLFCHQKMSNTKSTTFKSMSER